MNKRVRTVVLIAATLLGLAVVSFAYHVITGGSGAGAQVNGTLTGY